MTIRLYNSLTKKHEALVPLRANTITMYTCGPTVYDYVTIGNFRTYTMADYVNRTLKYNNYDVKYIMNITDVGHLTGDNEGDADFGEDRLEKAADKEGKSAREIADFYLKHFYNDYEGLNLLKPQKFTRATEYMREQIELIEALEKKGFTYKTSNGIYFDTSKFPNYGKLSGYLANSTTENRVEPNPEKKNPRDFALWKFSPTDERRWQEWESPWGVGFPGWHIECSAMSMSELGETIDLHLGGEDLKMTHHQNEIAQSECATGKPFVRYWMHGAFLQVDGGRMGKSLGNAYTVDDVISKGFNPLSLRYFYMGAHYRSPLNFTWQGLQSAESALKKLYGVVEGYEHNADAKVDGRFADKFIDAINDDFNMPKAIAVVWDMLRSDLDEGTKLATLIKFDEVLGFDVEKYIGIEIPEEIDNLAVMRNEYRKNNIWDKADQLRKEIEEKGYSIEDTGDTYKIKKQL